MFADVYDDWYPLAPEDEPAIDLLVELADNRPVLELGVGTGRLACAIAARGLPVWGIDCSVAMIDRLRAKPAGHDVIATVGDMAELPLPEDAPPFAVVFAAFNTLFSLGSFAAQAACFKRTSEVLHDDGHFVVEAFVPATGITGTGPVQVTRIGADSVVLRVTKWVEGGAVVAGHYIEITAEGTRHRACSSCLRFMPPAQNASARSLLSPSPQLKR